MGFTIRPYVDQDEPSWLRCRALSFLGTSYFDDVKRERTPFEDEAIRLVATRPRPEGMTTPGPDEIVGILDIELWSDAGQPVATIDTVAVHPDHQRTGIADALLATALPALAERSVAWLDAWTREDPEACGWYERQGFLVDQTYLHVYRGGDENTPDATGEDAFTAPFGLGAPVKGFFHGPDEAPEVWRARFARVHQCRRYLRPLRPRTWTDDPRAVATYDVECSGRWDHDHYLALAERLDARRVTDLGCGTGTLAIELAEAGREVIGLEPAHAMLAHARTKPGADRVT